MDCGVEITACNGFTLARDLAPWIAGLIERPRERCGRCVMLIDIAEAGGVEAFNRMHASATDDTVLK